jgi:hypothetical protein
MFPSDYKTVSTSLNSGVPLALSGDSDIATNFDQFTRNVLDPGGANAPASGPKKKSALGLDRIASLW